MNIGDFVTYFFSGKYPYTGIVTRKWKVLTRTLAFPVTYQYTIDILEITGKFSTFDIHEGDRYEVICEPI